MEIKKLRQLTGLSQSAFAKKYHIPLDTIKGWESDKNSKRHRNCPDHTLYLLERLIHIDFTN